MKADVSAPLAVVAERRRPGQLPDAGHVTLAVDVDAKERPVASEGRQQGRGRGDLPVWQQLMRVLSGGAVERNPRTGGAPRLLSALVQGVGGEAAKVLALNRVRQGSLAESCYALRDAPAHQFSEAADLVEESLLPRPDVNVAQRPGARLKESGVRRCQELVVQCGEGLDRSEETPMPPTRSDLHHQQGCTAQVARVTLCRPEV
mmetsp:Transcript_119337/g.371743  ORF Transcript_119337/g.371743 Transcript_119337/m.371743 type:complete len:204 (-) Transcript_119337:68-679(-)